MRRDVFLRGRRKGARPSRFSILSISSIPKARTLLAWRDVGSDTTGLGSQGFIHPPPSNSS